MLQKHIYEKIISNMGKNLTCYSCIKVTCIENACKKHFENSINYISDDIFEE